MPGPPKKVINRKLWIILGGIILANLIVWGIIAYGNTFLKKGSNQSPYRKMVTAPALLPHFEIKNSDGVVFSPKALDAKLNVIIFFTFKDCPSCLFEAEFWGEASRMFSEDYVHSNEIIQVEGPKKIEDEQREFPVRVFELYYKIR